jgi:hypothetical protein
MRIVEVFSCKQKKYHMLPEKSADVSGLERVFCLIKDFSG